MNDEQYISARGEVFKFLRNSRNIEIDKIGGLIDKYFKRNAFTSMTWTGFEKGQQPDDDKFLSICIFFEIDTICFGALIYFVLHGKELNSSMLRQMGPAMMNPMGFDIANLIANNGDRDISITFQAKEEKKKK